MTRPLPITRQQHSISGNAGVMRGSLSGWKPPHTYNHDQQANERMLTQGRAADLLANDWAANSGIESIGVSAIGTGLKPQSRINHKRLGITRDAALELQENIEAIYNEWTSVAHVRGMLHFEDLQLLGLRTMLGLGEQIQLPVKLDLPGRKIKLALQDVSPRRLLTPLDKRNDPGIFDGIESNYYGAPAYYWLATPSAVMGRAHDLTSLTSSQFTRVPASLGHRPGIFHLFRHMENEQYRGRSVLAPGMNLFRHLSDSVDNELLAQVINASMALFISQEEGTPLPNYITGGEQGDEEEPRYYQAIEPGTIMYGNKNQKPHMLESSRPSPNFKFFSEFIQRAQAASIGATYETHTKDFSKTNYSSARAAIMEAWRIIMLYRSWIVRHYCQPIFSMVIEEAWLSGQLALPAGAPDFYDARHLYSQALWIGPARGYVDPAKEIAATVTALENRLMTYSEALAERGRDFGETMEERREEEEVLATMPSIEKTSRVVVGSSDSSKSEEESVVSE